VRVRARVSVHKPEFQLYYYYHYYYLTSYESYPTQGRLNSILLKFVVSCNNMTDMQTCEVNGTPASIILAP